jgi:heme A synthase
VWTAADLRPGPARPVPRGRAGPARALAALLALAFATATSGALVAGLRAGKVYNTFPLMAGQVTPPGYGQLAPWWRNLFENHGAVQFNHRVLALLTLAAVVAVWAAYRGGADRRLARRLDLVLVAARAGGARDRDAPPRRPGRARRRAPGRRRAAARGGAARAPRHGGADRGTGRGTARGAPLRRRDGRERRMSGYHLLVMLHVLAALLWLGGMFFLGLVGAPVLRRVEPPALRQELFHRLGVRFRTVGWAAIGTLVVTGTLILHVRDLLTPAVLGDGAFWRSPFGIALAVKLAAVAAMIVASAVHDFHLGPAAGRAAPGSPQAAALRRRAATLARLNALVGLLLVAAAVRLARGG